MINIFHFEKSMKLKWLKLIMSSSLSGWYNYWINVLEILIKFLHLDLNGILKLKKIASEMPVPHSLGKYFQHHEIQKYCISINFRILSEHCQLYKGPNNV